MEAVETSFATSIDAECDLQMICGEWLGRASSRDGAKLLGLVEGNVGES